MGVSRHHLPTRTDTSVITRIQPRFKIEIFRETLAGDFWFAARVRDTEYYPAQSITVRSPNFDSPETELFAFKELGKAIHSSMEARLLKPE